VADAHLSWHEVAELAANGVTVASHGWDHVSLASLDAPQLAFQLQHSRRELERRLGTRVDAFAYPFGTQRDFSPMTERAVADAGYTLAFTAQHGAVRTGANRHALPRIKVEGGEPLYNEGAHFVECITEGRTPRSDGRQGLRVVRVLEAVEHSLRNNGVRVSLGECARP
jgi:predicted dehydrogenase